MATRTVAGIKSPTLVAGKLEKYCPGMDLIISDDIEDHGIQYNQVLEKILRIVTTTLQSEKKNTQEWS